MNAHTGEVMIIVGLAVLVAIPFVLVYFGDRL